MRKFFSATIGIVLVCWGIFSALSLLSDLHFLVDGLNWSIAHLAVSFKTVLLEIGKRISDVVSGYRALVRGLVRLLHLPVLPHYIYDALGVVSLSVGRGFGVYRRDRRELLEKLLPITIDLSDAESMEDKEKKVDAILKSRLREISEPLLVRFTHVTIVTLLPSMLQKIFDRFPVLYYSVFVAAVLSLLFGVYFIYRHIA